MIQMKGFACTHTVDSLKSLLNDHRLLSGVMNKESNVLDDIIENQ